MALITFPTIPAMRVAMKLVRSDSTLANFGGGETILRYGAAAWAITITLPPLKDDEAGAIRAALAQLSDLSNTFEITPPDWTSLAGYTGNNPTVNGTGQLGNSLVGVGASGSTRIVNAGDYLSVNGEFKVATADHNSAGSGAVLIPFAPDLRQSPPNGATIDVKTPKITCRLAEPVASWSAELPAHYSMQINAIETYGPGS